MIRKTTPLLFAGLVLTAAPLVAETYIYKDERGRTVMSDRKPSGKVSGARVIKDPAADAAAPAPAPVAAPPAATTPPGTDPELEKRRKAKEEAARAEAERQKQERERIEKEQLDTACKGLRQNLASLESGLPIARPNDKGEMVFLEDSLREGEKAQLRKQIADLCK